MIFCQLKPSAVIKMDTFLAELPKHHLYPRLVTALKLSAWYGKSVDIEKEIIKLAKDIPADELTPARVLYHACYWHLSGLLEFSRADKIAGDLGELKQNGIGEDGYYVSYSVSFDQCWPGIVADMAAAGLDIRRECGIIYISYTYLPDVWISTQDKWTGTKYSKYAIDFDFGALQKKMIGKYETPYQEEVITLRLLAQLPQPIAEAIEDCIRGVMERRFVPYQTPGLWYQSVGALDAELHYTAYPSHLYISAGKIKNKSAWEETVNAEIADDAAMRARSAEYGRGDSDSDVDSGPTCVFGGDDGW